VSSGWQKQRERGSIGALRIILWVALNLGRSSARLLLYPITLYFLITASTQRRASQRFFGRAMGRPARLVDIARNIHTFSATILDRVYLLSGKSDCFDIRYHNLDLAMNFAKRNIGAILLGSHLGSFEVLRSTAKLERNLKLKILMYPQQNERISSFFAEINPEMEETLIPLGKPDTLIRVEESISDGFLVGILGDRTLKEDKTVECRFLGKEMKFSSGPILLASILKVPVILFFGIYRGGNRYDIHFELLADKISIDRSQRTKELQQWTQLYVERLEYYARSAPDNWFNFYDFWNEDEDLV
jgi:predicted LPLAT superfamily acyltransferase